VDQAEELFLTADHDDIRGFGDRLLAETAAGTRVVVVIRTDFYGRLAEYPQLAQRVGPATVLVSPPSDAELRRIVTDPAARSGLRVDPALVDLVVSEVSGRPGALPVLSTALVRTWEHRRGDLLTVDSYRAGGGVAAVLERVGEEAWSLLPGDAERAACRRLLLRLATYEDGRWVRRRAPRAELTSAGDTAARTALAVLSRGRLVVARADHVEVSHEALLTGWPRLHGWLDEASARAHDREQLTAAALSWDEGGRDPGELYRGTRLQAALDLDALDLSPLEREFVACSTAAVEQGLAAERARADREALGRRRSRAVALGLAITLVAAALVGGYALRQQRSAERATTAADASRLGALARSGDDIGRDLLLAVEGTRLDPSNPATESNLFATLERSDKAIASMGYRQGVKDLATSPDGHSLIGVDAQGHLLRSDTSSGHRLGRLSLGRRVGHIGWTPDGTGLVVGLVDSPQGPPGLEIVDPVNGTVLAAGPRADPYAWTFTTGGRWLVSTDYIVLPDMLQGFGESSGLVVWKPGAPATTATSIPLGGHVDDLVSCGPATVCALRNGQVRRVTLPSGPVGPPVDVGTVGGQLLSSPDGSLLAVGHEGDVELRDSRTGALRGRLTGALGSPTPLAFSPDGTRLAAADGGDMLVWDVHVADDRATALPTRLADAGDDVAVWSTDSRTLITRGSGVLTWDLGGDRALGRVLTRSLPGDGTFETHNYTAWGAKDTVVVSGRSGWLAFIDSRTARMTVPSSPHHAPVATARAGTGGTPLVTADEAGVTAVWDVPSRRMLGTFTGLPTPDKWHATDVWVSPDDTTGATFRTRKGILLLDVRHRTVVRRLPPLPHDHQFWSYIDGWTGDGRRVLVMRRRADGTATEVLLVSARTGKVSLRIAGPMAFESAVDPRGRFIAVGGEDGVMRFYSQTDGRLLAPPQPATGGPIFNVSVSPDGRYVTAGSGAVATVPVFDTRNYRQVGADLPLVLPGDPLVTRARFTLDGSLIVVENREVQVFPIDPQAWEARACRIAGRNLTRDEWDEVLPGRPYERTCP
jgi:WD40 repeat protein